MGINDVLYLAGKDDKHVIIMAIRKTPQSEAGDPERKKIQVQIVCKGRVWERSGGIDHVINCKENQI